MKKEQVVIEGQFKIHLEAYLLLLHDHNPGHKFELLIGSKWVRIKESLKEDNTELGVFCFRDPSDGVIYKSETYNRPAKGGRGNIYGLKPLSYGALYKNCIRNVK